MISLQNLSSPFFEKKDTNIRNYNFWYKERYFKNERYSQMWRSRKFYMFFSLLYLDMFLPFLNTYIFLFHSYRLIAFMSCSIEYRKDSYLFICYFGIELSFTRVCRLFYSSFFFPFVFFVGYSNFSVCVD